MVAIQDLGSSFLIAWHTGRWLGGEVEVNNSTHLLPRRGQFPLDDALLREQRPILVLQGLETGRKLHDQQPTLCLVHGLSTMPRLLL